MGFSTASDPCGRTHRRSGALKVGIEGRTGGPSLRHTRPVPARLFGCNPHMTLFGAFPSIHAILHIHGNRAYACDALAAHSVLFRVSVNAITSFPEQTPTTTTMEGCHRLSGGCDDPFFLRTDAFCLTQHYGSNASNFEFLHRIRCLPDDVV